MTDTIKTKSEYVERLREMLAQDEPCRCCPVARNFSITAPVLKKFQCVNKICDWCREFIDCPKVDGSCPCGQLHGEALTRAHAAIKAWDKSLHKWQEK